jgi:polysaccharide biosynthesis protein PslH
MRILFLSTWFPYPPDNGSKLRTYYLLRALAARHEVTLLSFAWDTARPDVAAEVDLWCSQVRTVPIDPFQANQGSSLRAYLSTAPLFTRPLPSMSSLVHEALAACRFDALISSTLAMSTYALDAPRFTVRVLEEHNSLTRWMRERYESARPGLQRTRCWFAWQKTSRFEGRRFSQFDLVTMVSDLDGQTAQELVGGRRGQVQVVPNGVDCDRNRPGLAETQPDRLIFNGGLSYSANYDAMRWFLSEVYRNIKRLVPGISLTVTGSITGVDLAELAVDDSVRLTGFVDDVRLAVAEAVVCVVPIRQGGGTRLKILEAMALGTPVVSTRKGAEGLDVVDGEHLLLADDAMTFGSHVVALLQTQALRARLSANARRLVEERYDWAQIGGQFVSLIEEAAANRERAK